MNEPTQAEVIRSVEQRVNKLLDDMRESNMEPYVMDVTENSLRPLLRDIAMAHFNRISVATVQSALVYTIAVALLDMMERLHRGHPQDDVVEHTQQFCDQLANILSQEISSRWPVLN